MEKQVDSQQVEHSSVECLELAPELCEPYYSLTPEEGLGILPPLNKVEAGFNWFAMKLPALSAVLILVIALFISIDVIGRLLFNMPWVGITDLEGLFMCIVGFASLAVPIIERQSIQIDLFYDYFPSRMKRITYFFGCIVGMCSSAILAYLAFHAGLEWTRNTGILEITEWPFMTFTGFGLATGAIAFFFQICHIVKSMLARKEYLGIAIGLGMAVLLGSLPWIYKAFAPGWSGLTIGALGFCVLMCIMLIRVPLGFAMSAIGIIGLLTVSRRVSSALLSLGHIPFSNSTSFIMIAFPMFMLMGEMVALSGLSGDLFDAAKKWMGRLPGGLAVATVGGCAGFGAVCGDSMATCIAMNAVAMPAMREAGYSKPLATGALAAGGTLGILIPPSMGFIIYSMITEESVGKLFIAGVLPGILLATIFGILIIIRVFRHPDWAPKSPNYPLSEKLISLVKLTPVVILFLVVVVGILYGWFTPAEGGAAGAVIAAFFAGIRGKLNWRDFKEVMFRSAAMFGKLFVLFVGLFVLGSFLASSRLPNMLADTVAGLQVNRYLVLAAIMLLYVFLGCVMNIMPMMMLTLPSIYPTVQALGFDGIWFGVLCVIVMEMGMITPPVGMNVFTMAGLNPDIPMATIFRGILPFFVGMMICLVLVAAFPAIALYLVPGATW